MNKSDFFIVFILLILMGVWMYLSPRYISPPPPPAETTQNELLITPEYSQKDSDITSDILNTTNLDFSEKIVKLENDFIKLDVSSINGSIKASTLLQYNSSDSDEFSPIIFNFENLPALSLANTKYKNLTDFDINKINSKQISFSKIIDNNLKLERRITLGDNYLINIKDIYTNQSDYLQELPAFTIYSGIMKNPEDTHQMIGESILGVDSYTPEDGIFYWGKPNYINKKIFTKKNNSNFINTIPKDMINKQVDWVCAKNKFFAQIIHPKNFPASMRIVCNRNDKKELTSIAAGIDVSSRNLQANDQLILEYDYFIGPREFYTLKDYKQSYEKIREFETIGFWSGWNFIMEPIRIGLNSSLINIDKFIPGGYGIAIIILTIIIRLIFHPLHKKSTDSMKKMQEIQPLIKSLQEKYKSDPKKLQQETMILYKEKKVNPMGGCLPMFIQIPIFIALYTILRGAIELRYVDFLWINDLSAPENLFAGKIPIPFNSNDALNILPILMAVSMVLQQKMTSSAAAITPEQKQQQQIMMFMMPVMMLFFFYDMPSGLVLYWTVSNLLMIGQTGLKTLIKRKA